MAARYVLVVALAALVGRPAAANFCTAQRSLLAAPDAFVLGRERSCGLGDRWLAEHDSADILFRDLDLSYGNNTSLAAWLQSAGRSNSSSSGAASSGSPQPSLKVTSSRPASAGWRWDWWVSNSTAAERRFQQRISAVLVRPLVKFTARLGGDVPPVAISALLRHLMKESRPAVLAALREVTGEGGPERLLERDGGVVRTLASAVTELVVLTSGAAQQMRSAAAELLPRANASAAAGNASQAASGAASPAVSASASSSNTTSSSSTTSSSTDTPTGTPTASSQPEEPARSRRRSPRPTSRLASQSALMGRALVSLGESAPAAFGAASLLTVVPLAVLSLYLLFGVPAALLMAVSLYGGVLLAGTLAQGVVGGENDGLDAGLLLGRAVEAVLGGLFRMRLLRTLVMFALERLSG